MGKVTDHQTSERGRDTFQQLRSRPQSFGLIHYFTDSKQLHPDTRRAEVY